jgi:hypothetical protein
MADTTNVLTWRETLEVSNEDTAPLVLFLEPWAEPFVIRPHSAIEVIAYAPGEGQLPRSPAGGRSRRSSAVRSARQVGSGHGAL